MNERLAAQTMLGLAVGDHLGCLRKHRPKFISGQRTPWDDVEDMGEGGVHGIPPGGYSANTAFARCLVQSLAENSGKIVLEDVVERYRKAINIGLFCPTQVNEEADPEGGSEFKSGPVNLTARSLGADAVVVQAVERWSAEQTAHQNRSALVQFLVEFAGRGPNVKPAPGLPAENSSSCLVLTIPLAVAGCSDDSIRRVIGATHGSEYSLACCTALAGLFRIISDEANSFTNLSTLLEMWRPRFCPSDVARRGFEEELMPTRHVVYAMEAALFCLNQTGSFREAVLLAANLGGSSDVVGGVVGALAGCYYSKYYQNTENDSGNAVPADWKMRIYQGEKIYIEATRIADISKNSP